MQVLYIYIYANRNVLGVKEIINVDVRNSDENLPWRLCRGTAGGREGIAP